MAILDIGYSFRPQYIPLLHIPYDHDFKICHLPRDLDCYDQTSGTIALPWDIPNGTWDNCEYDCLCLCPCVGNMDRVSGMHLFVFICYSCLSDNDL